VIASADGVARPGVRVVPPPAGAALYPCTITHVRTARVRRAFSYRSYLWLIDLDRLPRLPPLLRPLATFRPQDHLGDPGAASIRVNVDTFLHHHGIDLNGGRVIMLAGARVFGYEFNPISVFWCYGADGALTAVLAEVHNTYSQRHVYLLRPDERGRAETDKEFYVSPFLPMAGRYRMRLPEPGRLLRLGVTLEIDGAPQLVAGVRGRRRPFTIPRLVGYSLRFGWASARVTVLIRWQAIRLLARRVPLIPRPVHSPQEGVQ
jgi:DUF1365 family protein